MPAGLHFEHRAGTAVEVEALDPFGSAALGGSRFMYGFSAQLEVPFEKVVAKITLALERKGSIR